MNRFSGLGVALLAAVVLAIIVLNVVFGPGGCSGGMIDPIQCTKPPDHIGSSLNAYEFHALITTSVIGVPSFSSYLLAGALTRWRNRNGY